MNPKVAMAGSIALAFIGGALLYDSTVLYLLKQWIGSDWYFGFDLKECIIGLLLVAAGAAIGLRTAQLRGAFICAVTALGIIAPLLIGIELKAPLPFTSRTEVVAVDTKYDQTPRMVRERYFSPIDPEPVRTRPFDPLLDTAPQPQTDAAMERAVRKRIAEKAAAKAALAAERERAAEQAVAQRIAEERARAVELTRREATASFSESQPNQRQIEQSPTQSLTPIAQGCDSDRETRPDSIARVEQATGSMQSPDVRYQPGAEALLKEAIEIDPYNLVASNRLSVYYRNVAKKPGRAVEIGKRSLELFPNCHMVYFSLGNALSATESYSEAIKNLQRAIDLAPEPAASYHYNLGNAYLKSGEPGTAVAPYLRALELKRDHQNARNNLTRAYLDSEQWQPIRELHANDAEALRRVGVTANRRNHHEVALSFFEQSLSVREEAETYIQIGIAYGTLKQMPQARAAAEKALELMPGHPMAKTIIRLANEAEGG